MKTLAGIAFAFFCFAIGIAQADEWTSYGNARVGYQIDAGGAARY